MVPLLVWMLATPPAAPITQSSAEPSHRPNVGATRISTPPRIDGILDDGAWAHPPLPTGLWETYSPLNGDTVLQQTRVWAAYDADALYFAFDCLDPEPSVIKSSVARRDNFGGDDWVGLSLDSLGTGQVSYHMMVNPNGIQLDLLNSIAGNEDATVDWVWDSAGRPTPTGYAVEIRLPLRSIRFTSGHGVTMGLLFWRKVSRLGISVAWPPIHAGHWVFESHAHLVLPDVQSRLTRDITPGLTVSERQSRAPGESWGATTSTEDVGFSAKLGLSSTMILDATVNPDFSQVESDVYQVEVNQRFPVFHSEKRPFFMEGAGLFSIAGSGNDNSLQVAVHTRRIVNPVVGVKLTGSAGRTTLATLSAIDETPAGHTVYNVGRAQVSLGPSNYLGALVTDVEADSRANRVAGADLAMRVSDTQRITASFLASQTHHPLDSGSDNHTGVGAAAGYQFRTRKVSFSGSLEHYDRGFQMDTAVTNRVGITSGWFYVDRSFYPQAKWSWMRRIAPFSFLQAGMDRVADGDDLLTVSGAQFNFTRQGFLRIDHAWGFEPWAGQHFSRGRSRTWGNAQVMRWLRLAGRWESGRALFYAPLDAFGGHSWRLNGSVTVQPSGRLSQNLSFDRVVFNRQDSGDPVFRVDIVNSKTTYQFTRRLQVRVVGQYDSSKNRILTDFLLSYEVNPASVAYIGYGGLFQRMPGALSEGTGLGDEPGILEHRFAMTDRALLVKVSYLKRF
jgi:hypothetical protein